MSASSSPAGDTIHRMRFNLRELAGSLGDLGTFLPITVALAVSSGLDFGWMLVAAGLMNIASGVLFRLPIPVQPMKAIAAVAIAEGLSGGAVVAAGWVMGTALTLIAVTGLMPLIDRLVPRPVVRAIQLGVGLKLTLTCFNWASELPLIGVDSVLAATLVGLAILIGTVYRWPIVLPVFVFGFVVLAVTHQSAYSALQINWPQPQWLAPSNADWRSGLMHGVPAQLPLTLLNSVIAVCALSGDCFPKQAIQTRKMALSVGLMNLTCIGWSGLPMCHGAGGLAAQYRAGARTGGSVVMLGTGKVIAGVVFGVSLIPLLAHYPMAILCPLVALAGLSLAYAGAQRTHGGDWWVVAPTAIVIAWTQTLYGFLIGLVLAAVSMLVRGNKPER